MYMYNKNVDYNNRDNHMQKVEQSAKYIAL